QSPKEVEVRFSDGVVEKRTLERRIPANRNDKQRQRFEVGREIEWVEVKVLSHYPGAVSAEGKEVTWGGIGEIEVITTADLAPYLEIPGYNPNAPAYVEVGSPKSDYANVRVHLPPPIPPGTHPGIYLTRDEIVAMRREIQSSDRARPMLEKLLGTCNEWLNRPIQHPDPNVPAQMRDRGDAQARAHSELSKMAGWFGWAYQLTDDERYAEKAREILVGYARLYPEGYKEHRGVHPSDTSKVMAQRLSEAMWLLPLIQAYDLIYHARCVTEADRRLIENDLIRAAITFINSKRPAEEEVAARTARDPNWRTADPAPTAGAVGNWMNFYNAAYIQGGIVLGDQNWIDLGAANTRAMIIQGIGEDGMWKEGAIGYQLFARQALVACMEPLARRGIDLYGYQQCRVKNLWDSPLKYAYPDGTAPGINDSGRSAVASDWTAMAYDFAYLRYQDPNYGGIVNRAARQVFQSEGCYFPTVIYRPLPEREIAALGSVLFNTLGYLVMRGADGGRQTYLLMDYGPHGGSHGHFDKLNLILFADGDELAGEPGFYRYEDARHAEWTRTTLSHWTVCVDQHEQAPCTGQLVAAYDAGAVKVMRGVATGAYAGVGLDRTVVQMPGYVADLFRAWSNTPHVYDYPLCFRGSLDALARVDATALKAMGAPNRRGYKHLAAVESRAPGNWVGTWERAAAPPQPEAEDPALRVGHPANRVRVTLLPAPDTTLFVGRNVDGRDQVVARRQAKETTFAAVVEPYRALQAVRSVTGVAATGPVPADALLITRSDGGSDLILVRHDAQRDGQPAAATTCRGAATDALVTVVRLDRRGNLLELGMVGGTRATYGSRALRLEKPGIAWWRAAGGTAGSAALPR
ncbi:MAG: heparinase II/III family protein, partial [Armatimonadota bacterium]|nr:heparinase II/III family protein [Armatimonadota bacterium]